MTSLEKAFAKRRKRADIQMFVLHTVAVAGVLSVALVAPGVLKALHTFGIRPKSRQEDIIRRSQRRLVKQGLLLWEDNKLRLTQKGERKLKKFEALNYAFAKPKRWDKRWRVLIFDIPEKRKTLRDKVRRILAAVGFVRLQDSVWIFPYPCEDLITLLKADFRIGKDMLYMIVDTLEYDQSIRKKFELS